jgi:hypothetical protein
MYKYNTGMNEQVRIEELQRWRREATSELETSLAALAAAQQHAEACRERLRLLDRLLAVETGEEGMAKAPESSMHPTQEQPADDLLHACEKIIRDAGRPLHIKELHASLRKGGVPIPGRGTEANLLVRLHRSNGRFVRTGRGTFAPTSMGVDEVKPTQRRRVRNRNVK